MRSSLIWILVIIFMPDKVLTDDPCQIPNINVCDFVCQGKGHISSPNYPHKYDENLNCKWTIQSTNGGPVFLHFTNVSVSCPVGVIEVYDGVKLLDKSDGLNNFTEKYFISTHDILNVRFHTSTDLCSGMASNTPIGFFAYFDESGSRKTETTTPSTRATRATTVQSNSSNFSAPGRILTEATGPNNTKNVTESSLVEAQDEESTSVPVWLYVTITVPLIIITAVVVYCLSEQKKTRLKVAPKDSVYSRISLPTCNEDNSNADHRKREITITGSTPPVHSAPVSTQFPK